MGVIEESVSPFSFPILVVAKKGFDEQGNPKKRVCIDMGKLNAVTQKADFPLPTINSLIKNIKHKRYYTVIDLASAFMQIKVCKEDRHKLAFKLKDNNEFQFKRVPLGFILSSFALCKVVATVFRDMIDYDECKAYMDDLFLESDTVEQMIELVEKVFQRLTKHNLKISPEKLDFYKFSVVFLGHEVSEQGLKPHHDKTKAIASMKAPKNIREIQSFAIRDAIYNSPTFTYRNQPSDKL